MDNLKRRESLILSTSSQTLWSSEKSTKDSRSSDGNSSNKHDKGVNVQVILRCRPLSEDETRVNTPVMISCNELKREVTAIQNNCSKQMDKTFIFDKVFGPTSKQRDLYEQVVAPIVNEALEGYNCTIFTYGQTGTGKTYTMEGEGRKEKNGQFHKETGVIPRAVQQIFDVLEAQNAEYNMKVTFIEIYNEEITDLLAPEESSKNVDKRIKRPIALMEDGKGAVFARGIEEEIVYSAGEINKILEKGSAKKHTADTLLNKQSNRSHSMFTITLQIKECNSEGVELIKCGKLNLFDLAGSENILRSGARERRAREAGEINKSLLTLGRVINALVEQSGHVPYRDSKLTRLLRDSLGGRTKTCIIATVSPSVNCSEETFSTLDYAYRAKNIKNRPEVNQKVIKSEVIKDLYMDIDRLKQELHATREKNGIYIPRERYLNEEAAKKMMTENLRRMELDSMFKDKQLMKLQDLYLYQQQLTTELTEKFERTNREFEQTEQALFDLEDKYTHANETIKEKEYLIFNLLRSEKALTERAFELRVELENAASEVSSLFEKLEHKNSIEDGNKFLIQKFNTQLAHQMEVLHQALSASVTQQQQQLKLIQENTQTFLFQKEKASEELRTRIRKLKDMYGYGIKSLVDLAGELDGTSQLTFGEIKSKVSNYSSSLSKFIGEISSVVNAILNDLESNLYNQEQSIATFAQQQHESHSRTYETSHSISRVTVNFFKTVSTYVSKVTQTVEEAQKINEQKLYTLEKKYEEYADKEERQLLDKMAELLASSNTRKKKLVQTVAHDHRDITNSTATKLYREMSELQEFTSSAQEEWTSYMEETEKHYIEDTTAVESGKDGLGGGLRHCMTKARLVTEQWRPVEESYLSLQRSHINSMDSILQGGGVETNRTMYVHISALGSTTLEEADTASKSSISTIDYLVRADQDQHEKINSLIGPCHEDMQQMGHAHFGKIVKIAENAEKCLVNDYMVDETLCSTPRKRQFNLPSRTSIEELRTPSFEEILKKIRWGGSEKQANGNFYLDSRVPPTTSIN